MNKSQPLFEKLKCSIIRQMGTDTFQLKVLSHVLITSAQLGVAVGDVSTVSIRAHSH